tara:strand:- start:1464 stop:2768 length:1305 start_codon:yes stop_codon:yes gene_type:complete
MDDLLKDAIADAKAVRETALANAKVALEEAFTPRIQSMLSQKIQSEVEDEEVPHDEDEMSDEEAPEAPAMEAPAEEEPEIAAEPEMGEEPSDEIADEMEEPSDEIADEMEEPSDEIADEGVIEINGVKYAPVVSEEEEEEPSDEMYKEEEEDKDDLDLEAILRELEDEADEGEEVHEDYDENAVGDGHDSDEVKTADEAELAENDVSSDIGAGDNKVNDEAGDSSKTGAQGPEGEGSDSESGKEDDNLEVVDDLVEVNGVKYSKVQEEEDADEGEDMEEDIDLEEILKALSEGDDEDKEDAEAKDEAVKNLTSELEEHRNVVKYLRSKLNEVNLLNAKLLFTNKLFRAHGLNNEQKLKVVETFDRAKNLREVKLVFSTLAESFGNQAASTSKPIKESKGSASKAVASTKPKSTPKVIEEGMDMKKRFQKLANIL